MSEALERHQVPLYLAAVAFGALLGSPWSAQPPPVAAVAAAVVDPGIVALLYVTFLGVPFTRMRRAMRDGRFLGTLALVNGVVAPALAVALVLLARPAWGLPAELVPAALLVLLAPCVDYVMVFTRLAGGDDARLLTASPLLMAGQAVGVPVLLWLVAGPGAVPVGLFARAFLLFVALPLAAAVLTQVLAPRVAVAGVLAERAASVMVPLMMLVLASIVAAQAHVVAEHARALVGLVPVYVAFAALMPVAGALLGRRSGTDVAGRRALAFSGATRNSLVVLPLARALPAAAAPAAVVLQTLVELVAMVVLVRAVPALVSDRVADTPRSGVGGSTEAATGTGTDGVTGR